MLKNIMISVARKLPGLGPFIAAHDQFVRDCGFVPPGHYYSPIPR